MKSHRRVQYWAALAVSLASLCGGTTYFWITSTLPRFHNKEIIANITNSEISWVVSIMIVGLVIGSGIASVVSDKYGRRTTLTTSAVPHIVGTVFVFCSTNTWMLYIGRILWGVSVGMSSTVSSVYLSEIADKEIRGTLTVLTRIMFSVGIMIVLTTGSIVSYQVLNGMMVVFPALYFVACMCIPESPYYLLKEGKVDAAKKALLKLGGHNDEKVIDEKLSLLRSDVRKEMSREGSIKELVTGKQYRRALIAAVGVRAITLLSGMIPMQQYFGRILQQSSPNIDVPTLLIVFGGIRLIISLLSPLTVDRIGRRPLLISSFSATSVILAIIGLYFFIQQVIGVSVESLNPFRYVVFVAVTAASGLANIGFNVLMFIIPAELFPLNVKSIAMTALFIMTSVLQFVVVRGYQIMEDLVGLYGVFWFYTMMTFTGAVFSYFFVPETRGKSLREIQIELQGNIYDESCENLNQVEVANGNGVQSQELKDIIKDDK